METEVEFIRDKDKSYAILDAGIKFYGRYANLAFDLSNLRTSNSLTIYNNNTDSFHKHITFDAKFVKLGESVSFFGNENIIQKYQVFILAVKGQVVDECVIVPQPKNELADEDTIVFQCNFSEERYNDLVNSINNSNKIRFFCTPKGDFYAQYSPDPFYERFTEYKIADSSNKRKVKNPKKLKKFEEYWVDANEVLEFTFQFIDNQEDANSNKNKNSISSTEENLNESYENKEIKDKIDTLIYDNQKLSNHLKDLENNVKNFREDRIQSLKNNNNINLKRIEKLFGLILTILIILIILIIFKVI